MKKLLSLFALIASLLPAAPGYAQNVTVKVVSSCGAETIPTTSPGAIRMDATGKLCTAASVSASITGFAPGATGTPISVTTSSATGTLPAGAVVVATNVGATNGAYCALGATATTASQYLSPGGGWFAFTIGASTQLSCITSTSTTTVNMTGGSGLPTGTGGGGGGGGGGGAITAASGSYAAGAMSAGSYAAGALAAGSFATGAGVDGWDITQGAKADAVCGTATGTCSVVALLKFLNTASGLPLPAQSVRTINIGEVDVDFSRMASAAINVSTITTTQIVALSGSTKVYVTSYDVIAGGTGNITFVYGTGSSCGTGTTSLTGAYNLTAQAGIAKGSGVAPVLVVPAGNALCVTTSAAVQMSGSVSYQQF